MSSGETGFQNIRLGDDGKLRLGDDGDFAMSFDGANLAIEKIGSTGDVIVKGCQLRSQRHEFAHMPTIHQDDGTIGSGGDTDVNMHTFHDGLVLYVENINAQTILKPAINALGLDYGYDQTDTDGIQWVMRQNGTKGVLNKDYFVVGTSPAFFAELKLSIADVSGTADCAFGVRKDEAFQALIDNYDEMACLNVISGDITAEAILNGAATDSDDTGDDLADAGSVTLRVNVSAAGVVTYLVDGVAPTTAPSAFTFDDAEVVTPFFYFVNSTDLAGAVVLQHIETGLQ